MKLVEVIKATVGIYGVRICLLEKKNEKGYS